MLIRVYYEDTDCCGIVYHSNYISFCERARSELFFSKGLSPHSSEYFFVARHLEAEFIKSAKLGDMLDIKCENITKKRASLCMEQNIYKEKELIFSLKITLVYVHNEKACKIPEEVFDFFKTIK